MSHMSNRIFTGYNIFEMISTQVLSGYTAQLEEHNIVPQKKNAYTVVQTQ